MRTALVSLVTVLATTITGCDNGTAAPQPDGPTPTGTPHATPTLPDDLNPAG